MKKILNEWRNFLSEGQENIEQDRIDLGIKMRTVLFKSIDPMDDPQSYKDTGPDILMKYRYLHWAIYGTKEERRLKKKIYRPESGLEFARQKVIYFIKQLSPAEVETLQTDLPQLISILRDRTIRIPSFPVQVPVELTGHRGVDVSFRVPMFGRSSIDDWGMGGTVRDPKGQSYLIHILTLISKWLPPPTQTKELSDEHIASLYFMSETKEEMQIQNQPATSTNKHFSSMAGLSYEEIMNKVMGKK